MTNQGVRDTNRRWNPGETSAWFRATFEGSYVGQAFYEPGISASTRYYALRLVKGKASNIESVAGPPPANTPPPFRQKELARCYLVNDGAANPELALTTVYDLQVHHWQAKDTREVQGCTYGNLEGTLYARRKPHPKSLRESVKALGDRASRVSVRTSPFLFLSALCALAPTCSAGSGAGGGGILLLALMPLLALALLRTGQRDHGGAVPIWRRTLSLVVGGLSLVLTFATYEHTCLDLGSHALDTWGALTTRPDSAPSLDIVRRQGEAPGEMRLTVKEALARTDDALGDRSKRIYLDADLLFGSGSSSLKSPPPPELAELAILLRRLATRHAVIEGHADTLGAPADNLRLSRERAESVRRWLINEGHVNPTQLTASGLGSTKPLVAPTGDSDAQKANRRVEVVLD